MELPSLISEFLEAKAETERDMLYREPSDICLVSQLFKLSQETTKTDDPPNEAEPSHLLKLEACSGSPWADYYFTPSESPHVGPNALHHYCHA